MLAILHLQLAHEAMNTNKYKESYKFAAIALVCANCIMVRSASRSDIPIAQLEVVEDVIYT